ncbi:MAG: hypothetical protein IKS52_09770 [Clostridia bacterium]|nr:hypothetical protein [Clostridia bacterium]
MELQLCGMSFHKRDHRFEILIYTCFIKTYTPAKQYIRRGRQKSCKSTEFASACEHDRKANAAAVSESEHL